MGRLIDADALIENLRGYKTIYGCPMTKRDEQVIHYVIGHIKNLEPTAYDADKVEQQIEEMFGVDAAYYGKEVKWAVDKAREIVRKGCVKNE